MEEKSAARFDQRYQAHLKQPCCGAVMVIVKTRIPPAHRRVCDPPLATGVNH